MLPGTQTRSLKSFRNYNLASSEDRKGLNSQLLLALMKTFSGPFFFMLDKMYDLCHGIGKQCLERRDKEFAECVQNLVTQKALLDLVQICNLLMSWKSIKYISQISVNAGNIMIRLIQSQCVVELTIVTNTKTLPANLLVYSTYTDRSPVTEEDDPVNAECEIEF
ncbi:hypothetical protein PHYBLDRAFT_145980 [Phycomyces blakesleeanus NRRL 1555(-)]|uniref:Uncharacterized protein n=1 Tax=Phycomyces blakesleeanus (strain ATCC 8743b / DSM 1359 / FGSC 10004 / NBRC 33097 / NRRL 1555) TaxID=763407 RepID=A0A167MEZ2_PHYB8|nr:hypothetical protein PHYBLDRAFT_145980 [Phycomyces blakesleeanus NRRL 1555(-)]OAD72664.1 hypothetical protein PHYBLDRAFT_145980 [Phycomyces blakesleeanus NRRL 1555(-)]|eukprot:XP_018290704.1 hypothetical protein PHYBLDRAFT_145980 [Phycomyces blakesleeanus NRRL 1555(-)]